MASCTAGKIPEPMSFFVNPALSNSMYALHKTNKMRGQHSVYPEIGLASMLSMQHQGSRYVRKHVHVDGSSCAQKIEAQTSIGNRYSQVSHSHNQMKQGQRYMKGLLRATHQEMRKKGLTSHEPPQNCSAEGILAYFVEASKWTCLTFPISLKRLLISFSYREADSGTPII